MHRERPLILLANDDGIFAEGLHALERVLPRLGDLYVVAPDRERNAASHCLSLADPIYVKSEGTNRFAMSGTPTDCVNIAVHRLLPRKPDLVVSGINRGGNLAEDVTYSGTVAAALEGRLLGIPSVAVSLVAQDQFHYDPAAEVGLRMAEWVLANGLPPGVFLNVNVPGLLDGSPARIRWTRMGHKDYGDFLEEGADEAGRRFFRFGRDALLYDRTQTAEADWKAVELGYVSVTPLQVDVTAHDHLDSLKALYEGDRHAGQPGARSTPDPNG